MIRTPHLSFSCGLEPPSHVSHESSLSCFITEQLSFSRAHGWQVCSLGRTWSLCVTFGRANPLLLLCLFTKHESLGLGTCLNGRVMAQNVSQGPYFHSQHPNYKKTKRPTLLNGVTPAHTSKEIIIKTQGSCTLRSHLSHCLLITGITQEYLRSAESGLHPRPWS